MPLDAQPPAGVLAEQLQDLSQHGLGFGLEPRAARVELDAVDGHVARL
jgi:hypothetical protein